VENDFTHSSPALFDAEIKIRHAELEIKNIPVIKKKYSFRIRIKHKPRAKSAAARK